MSSALSVPLGSVFRCTINTGRVMKNYDGTNYPKSLDADLVGEIDCILFRPRQLPKKMRDITRLVFPIGTLCNNSDKVYN